MCSRFENKTTGEFLFKKISKERKVTNNSSNLLKQFGIAPNDDITILKSNSGELEITTYVWGIRFSGENTPLIFNSRIETITSKKYWSDLFSKSRCIIPATAFYEWKKEEKIKIPQRISLPENELFFIAGIYAKINGDYYVSMITSPSNTKISRIHARMPVILSFKIGLDYLDAKPEKAIDFCVPLDDNIELDISTATDILTRKQIEYLEKGNK